ncbi:MAG: hypothetical protein KF862_07435 [Chitinophagaceae bacterium]|nr:hypothetical protein [Chitinophagaceae bacterium]
MPRIRTIKPTHHSDRKLPEISLQAHLLWVLNWCWSDDEGIFENDPLLIRSNNFPRRTDIRVEQIIQWLDQLVKARFLVPFTYNGEGYYINRTFKTHQKIDRPQASKIPLDVIFSIRGQFDERSTIDRDDSTQYSNVLESSVEESKGEYLGAPSAPTAPPDVGKKSKKKPVEQKKFVPPSLSEVEKYFIATMGNPTDPRCWMEAKCINQAGQCFDHYTANGWVQGRGKPIKNWQASCRNWIRNELNGTYGPVRKSEPPQKKNEEPPPALSVEATPSPPAMPKTAVEINYLFERFMEGQVTIISVDAAHYDYLKKAGRINWTKEQTAAISQQAKDHITEKSLPADEKNVLKFMKLFGVIEYFQQQKTKGDEKIFCEKDFSGAAAFRAQTPVLYRH